MTSWRGSSEASDKSNENQRHSNIQTIAHYPILPDRMKADWVNKGKLYYEYTTSDENRFNNKTVKLHQYEVLHITELGFDGLVGYSPIAMAKNAIGMSIVCKEFGAKFFESRTSPSGVLEHSGTSKDQERARQTGQSQFEGSANSGKIAVLAEGMKYS